MAGDLNTETLDAVAAKVREAGGEMTAVQTNIAIREQAEALVDAALARHGRLDILVNNAGVLDNFSKRVNGAIIPVDGGWTTR